MKKQFLHGEWTLSFFEEGPTQPETPEDLVGCSYQTVTAEVPGNVELDLARAGILPKDLYLDSNILSVRDFEFHQWWFSYQFDTPQWHLQSETELVFEGLDCFATIWINGKEIARTVNSLIVHRFNVGKFLASDGRKNVINIRLRSPVNAVKHLPIEVNANDDVYKFEAQWARKPSHCYGWDIMPRALSAGIWRPVYLAEKRDTELEEVFIDTIMATEEHATLVFHGSFRTSKPLRNFSLRLTGCCGQSTFVKEMPMFFTVTDFRIPVEHPKLWFPRGYGEPHLYNVAVQLLHENKVVSEIQRTVGIRTVSLIKTSLHTPEQSGKFEFSVNGVTIFCRGANHVPADVFHSRDAEKLEKIVRCFADANCNMLRCWGGNVYEPTEFYDLCDQTGIMVWQDFAMACNHMRVQHPDFLEMMRQEAEQVVKLLRQHACLSLWCGDNECDSCTEGGWREWGDRKRDPNANRITREIFPEVLRLHDPMHSYLPSSPYVSPEAHAAADASGPDWARNLLPEQHAYPAFDPNEIAKIRAVFMGEIGFAGMPSAESVTRFLSPKNCWPWRNNTHWLVHATDSVGYYRTWGRIERLEHAIQQFFGISPESLEMFCELSQYVQAEALKYIVESFRSRKGETSGILLWNMVDGWPQFSEALVDCYFVPKLAYFAVQRAYRPLSVIAVAEKDRLGLVIVNDSQKTKSGHLTVSNIETREILWNMPFDVTPNSRLECGNIAIEPGQHCFCLEWHETNMDQPDRNYVITGEPPYDYQLYRNWVDQFYVKIQV